MARKKANKTPEVEAVTTPEVKQEEVKAEVAVAPAPAKAKKSVAPFLLLGLVAILLVAGIVAKIMISSPKHVFTTCINSVYKDVSNTLKEIEEIYQPDKEAIEIKGTMKIDTNMDSEELLDADVNIKNLKFDFSTGIDIPHKEVLLSAGVEGKDERIGGKIYYTDGAEYLQTTFYDSIIKLGDDIGVDVDELNDYLEAAGNTDISLSLYDDILEAFTKALTSSLDKEAMSKEKDEIEVLDKELKVTKNSYKLTEKTVQKLAKSLAENLLDNKDFIKNLAKATGLDKDDIKEGLKTLKEEAKDISFEGKITINIYTKGIINSFAGIDIYADKEKMISWYEDGENVEAKAEDVVFTIKKDGKEKKAKLTVNGEKLMTATIRSYDKEKIDFDFIIYEDDEELTKGSIYFTRKDKKKTISGEYKVKVQYEDEWVEVSGDYSLETKDKLDGLKTSGAIDSEDLDMDKFLEALKDVAKKDDDLDVIINDSIDEYEKEKLQSKLNYYDMYTVTSKEAVDLLSSSKPTVLYVGVSYYSANDPYYMFHNLEFVQDDFDFHSYMYDTGYVSDEFKAAVAGVEFTCNSTVEPAEGEERKCADWPAIFIIKGGEVKYAFRGTVSEETLTAAFKDVGL